MLHTSFIYNLLHQLSYFTKSKDKIFVSIYTNKIKSILSNNGFGVFRNKFPFLHKFFSVILKNTDNFDLSKVQTRFII